MADPLADFEFDDVISLWYDVVIDTDLTTNKMIEFEIYSMCARNNVN